MDYAARVKWLVGLAILVACGKSKPDCKHQVDELVKLLRSVDHDPQFIEVADDIHLVQRTDLPHEALVSGPVIVLNATSISYQGHLAEDAVALRARLEASFRQLQEDSGAGKLGPHLQWDHRVYLEVDRDVRWGTVAAVAGAAADAGFERAMFVLARPGNVPRPPRAPIDDELDRIMTGDSSTKAVQLAKLVGKQVEACKPLLRVFGNVASEEAGDKAGAIIDGMGPALLECDCNADMANLRSAMYRLVANEHPVSVLALSRAHDATPVELPATMAWADAAGKLAPGGRAWLVAK